MRYRILFSSCLLLVSCDKPREDAAVPAPPAADQALRGLLGVRSITSLVETPADAKIYQLTTLEITEGKITGRGPIVQGNADGDFWVDFVWTGDMEVLTTRGHISRSTGNFWQKSMSCYAFEGGGKHPVYDDYLVIGFAQSPDDYKGKEIGWVSADFNAAVQNRKHVGAVVVKFFPDVESARRNIERSVAPND